jgi:dTDP-L-rhamnose 4-epimerase
MRILVTGGAGFIGSHTVDALIARGHQVRILDSLEKPVHLHGKPAYLNPAAEFVLGDVTKREDWIAALAGVEAVFHFAAYQDYLPDFSKFFRVNAVGTALLYELLVELKLPVRKVVVASSQAVYGEGRHRCPDGRVVYPGLRSEERLRAGRFEIPCPHGGGETQWLPTDETVVNPQNQYALSKHAQEQIALQLGKRYGIPSVGMRYSIVQGPRQSFWNAYSGACRVFCLSFHVGRVPPIYEDGLQVRDFVNVHDVVDANLRVLARIVAQAFGREFDAKPSGAYRFGDTRHIVSDVTKLRALGWEPKRTPADSVAEYVAWLRAQGDIDDILAFAEKQMRAMGVVRAVAG